MYDSPSQIAEKDVKELAQHLIFGSSFWHLNILVSPAILLGTVQIGQCEPAELIQRLSLLKRIHSHLDIPLLELATKPLSEIIRHVRFLRLNLPDHSPLFSLFDEGLVPLMVKERYVMVLLHWFVIH